MLGIDLTDSDVGNVPLLSTDQYGNFIPGANGFPQLITGIGGDGIPNTADDDRRRGHTGGPGQPDNRLSPSAPTSAFLTDIAHDAVPVGKIADGDITIGLANPGNGDTEYDNELLDAHYIAGDGRVNENIGLTAVHHVFHSEHNRLVEHTKDVVLAQPSGSRLPQRVAGPDVAAVPADPGGDCGAGRGTASACSRRRSSAPRCSISIWCSRSSHARSSRRSTRSSCPDGFDTTINPAIVAEFAHTVYRFGHSMLTESIDRFDPNFNADQIGLIEAFLNPLAFDGARGLTPTASRRRHRPRHDAAGRQRDRRVRDRGAAQQPARPAARPRGHQPGARPRHRHSLAERGAPRVLRGDQRAASSSLTRAGSTLPATSSTRSRSSTSSPPTARTR